MSDDFRPYLVETARVAEKTSLYCLNWVKMCYESLGIPPTQRITAEEKAGFLREFQKRHEEARSVWSALPGSITRPFNKWNVRSAPPSSLLTRTD